MSSYRFQLLNESLIPSACRLSSLVGWNQTEEDWRRLLRLNPQSVRVWTDAGELRASYSLNNYGTSLAWIGMILADPEYRGRGLGKAAFAEALESASKEYPVVGLDASDQGEPIYLKFGFERITPIARWQGVLPTGTGEKDLSALGHGLSSGVLDLDLQCTGIDRSPLLADLAQSARLFRLDRSGTTAAYAVVRPGRCAIHLGPVVARSRKDFEEIFELLASQLAGQQVICDVIRGDIDEELRACGLSPARQLQRMTLPRKEGCLQGEGIWMAAGFEWG